MQLLNVARFWEIDPEAVGRWMMVDFADREEYMFMSINQASITGDNDDDDREDWSPDRKK